MEQLEKTFDTLKASRNLQDSGMPMEQANATASTIADAFRGLVTRSHFDEKLENLQARLDARFEKVYNRFEKIDNRFVRMENRFEKVDDRIGKLESKVDSGFEKVDARFVSFEVRTERNLARWALTLVVSQVSIMGLLFALIRFYG